MEKCIPETLTCLTIYSKTLLNLKRQSNLKEFLMKVLIKNIQHLEFINFSNCDVLEEVFYNLDEYKSLRSLSFKMWNNIPTIYDQESGNKLDSFETTKFPSADFKKYFC